MKKLITIFVFYRYNCLSFLVKFSLSEVLVKFHIGHTEKKLVFFLSQTTNSSWWNREIRLPNLKDDWLLSNGIKSDKPPSNL